MILSLLVIFECHLGNQSRQGLDRQGLLFLGQGFPRVGMVEQQIEKVSIFFSRKRSRSWAGSCHPRELHERGDWGLPREVSRWVE